MVLWRFSLCSIPLLLLLSIAVPTQISFATEPDPEKCKEVVKPISGRQLIANLAQKMGAFMSHLQRPELAGKGPAETMNNFGAMLQKNPEALVAFHKDFNQMMRAFEAIKTSPLLQAEAKQVFALVLDQTILSRTFVLSFYAAQSTTKILKDPSVIVDGKFYNTEDADILIFSVLSHAFKSISEDLDDDDDAKGPGSKISLEAGARKIIGALEGNSFHPDGLLEGVRMSKMLFSSDPQLKAQGEQWHKDKGERAQRLRAPFRHYWLKGSAEK